MVHTSIFGRWELTAGQAGAKTNEELFTAFVDRNSRFVYRVAYAVLRNTADAEDAAQETFFKLYRLRVWQSVEDERAFLARAVWRIAIGRKRRPLEQVPEVTWAGRNPEQEAIAADQDAWLHRLIDALPEELRLPLALSSAEQLTSAEIGKITGLPEGTVRTRMARARRILKAKIEERYGTR